MPRPSAGTLPGRCRGGAPRPSQILGSAVGAVTAVVVAPTLR